VEPAQSSPTGFALTAFAVVAVGVVFGALWLTNRGLSTLKTEAEEAEIRRRIEAARKAGR
jgi:hypothetical protein